MFLLQMAGYPGSGKSNLAKEISKVTDAIIIDVDIIKTALIESGIDSNQIANAAYHSMFSLCEYYIGQNRDVIVDCPSHYSEILEKGINISNKYKAEYKFVECRLDSFEETNKRLRERNNKQSQYTSTNEEDFYFWFGKSHKPTDLKYLTVDTSMPISDYLQQVIQYINTVE